MDDILMKLGELTAERRHRKENETSVEVRYRDFILSWQVGNYLDIYASSDCEPFETEKTFLARIDVAQFDCFVQSN